MTIAEALREHQDAEILLRHVLNADKSARYNIAFLYANLNRRLAKLQETEFRKLIAKRKRGVPAAYLTGHKEFFGLDFIVNRNVLIPRPETELLVELALKWAASPPIPPQAWGGWSDPGRTGRGRTVIDVGTGSGNIIISLAKSLNGQRGRIRLFAIDSSAKALRIARRNARRHGVAKKIKFLRGNLLETSPLIPLLMRRGKGGPGLILANLPYLTPSQYRANPDLRHEPRSALVARADGLKYYRELFKQLTALERRHPREGGGPVDSPNLAEASRGGRFRGNDITLLLEFDPRQKPALKKLAAALLPQQAKLTFHRDLAGRNRVMELCLA